MEQLSKWNRLGGTVEQVEQLRKWQLFRGIAKKHLKVREEKSMGGTGGTVKLLYFAGNALDAHRYATSARRKEFANYLAREETVPLFHPHRMYG